MEIFRFFVLVIASDLIIIRIGLNNPHACGLFNPMLL